MSATALLDVVHAELAARGAQPLPQSAADPAGTSGPLDGQTVYGVGGCEVLVRDDVVYAGRPAVEVYGADGASVWLWETTPHGKALAHLRVALGGA